MTTKSGSLLKVSLRVGTMRVAGAWMEGMLREDQALSGCIFPDAINFYLSLSKRTGAKVEMERGLAERLVSDWIGDFKKYDRTLLLRVSDAPFPDDGLHAMAEIMLAIKVALRRKRGRQHQIDPLEAYEINECAKKTRRRSAAGEIGDQHAHEQVAETLGVSSKGTISAAVKNGKETVEEWRDKASQLPNGVEVLMNLVDYAAPPGQRVKATIFTSKRIPPFTGENSE